MSAKFTTVASELPRDRWGRPLITPPSGGEPVAYTRATTYAGTIDDTFHLTKWKQRQTLLGLVNRRDLYLAVLAADPEDKKTLNGLAEAAMEASGASSRANTGTALHSLSEKVDRAEPLGYVPEEYEADLAAYASLMRAFTIIAIEGFCVMDDIQVGGTYDRIVRLDEDGLRHPDGTPAGGNYVFDLKTGSSVDLGAGKIAQQLGIYSRSVNYDHRDGSRSPLPDVHQKYGIVVHLPAGSGVATRQWFNIEAGWEAAYALSGPVRAFRARKDLNVPFGSVRSSSSAIPLAEQIRSASSEAVLRSLYKEHRLSWTPGLTSLASARKLELAGVSYPSPIVPLCPRCGTATITVPCCVGGDRSSCPACEWEVWPC